MVGGEGGVRAREVGTRLREQRGICPVVIVFRGGVFVDEVEGDLFVRHHGLEAVFLRRIVGGGSRFEIERSE